MPKIGPALRNQKAFGFLDTEQCCARVLEPVVIGLPFAILLFGIYELVDHELEASMDLRAVHFVHLIGVVVLSLVVTVIASWSIINSAPGFLADVSNMQALGPVGRSESARTKLYAQWFIAMRWIAVMLAGALIVVSVQVLHWLPDEVWWPLVGTLATLAASNILYLILLRCGRTLSTVLTFQGYFDLLILTVLLHYSGGIENPLMMMMIFHIIIGGVLLSRRQCYCLAGAGSALFALMAWAEWADMIEHYTLLLYPHFKEQNGELFHPAHHPIYASSRVALQTTVLFLTAYFVTSLAERLRQNERRLAAMADHALAGQQLLERALETTGTALRVLEADIQTSWANARWREWFERAGVADGKGAAVLSGLNAPARQTLADGQIRLTEVVIGGPARLGEKGGPDRSYVFQVTTAPLRESAGKVRQVVELAQDVTAQKQAQAQLVRAGQLAAVGELAGQVAHEVNNPIGIISAKARLLLADHHDEMSPKIAQELEKMTDLADRVARIAQGLLSYCRPSRAHRERLDIRQPVRKCLAMVDRHARSSGIVIYDELPVVLPDVNSNPQELEQVFLNLVINALDAMPTGGELRVSAAPVELTNGEPGVAVRVADTGVGIEAKIRGRIFEPFFTTKQEGCGTGLGLSIGLGLVRESGGDIEVESEPGLGSRFTVKLPVFTANKGPSHG